MTKLEEIKNKYTGSFLFHAKKNGLAEDIIWLITQLEQAIEILSWKESYILNDRARRIKKEFLEGLK